MKRILRTTFPVFILLFLVTMTFLPQASGAGTIEAYTHQTETVTGEEIVWYVGLAGFSEPSECAFFLYRDMVLVAYEPPSDAKTYRYTPQEAGIYSLVVLARDGTGVRTASGGNVVVHEPLHIESLTVNRPRIPLGASATWTACTQGGSGDASFGFFVYRDGELLDLCVPDDPKSGILNYTPNMPGTYTVDVLAIDASGKAKMAGAPIIVTDGGQESKPLMLTSVFANAPDALVGEEIVWTATASGGTEAIAFSFFLYKDGVLVSLTPVGTSSVFRMTPTEPGIYAVSAHAGSGLESANLMSGNVTVTRPAGIRLTGVACDRNKAVIGESLTFWAQAEGASGEIAYSFALYRDWALMGLNETGASPAFTFAPGEAGTYYVIAYAKDDIRSTSAHSAEVRVVSTKLTVDSVTADQLTGSLGKPVTWTVHTTGGENLQYVYFVYYLDQVICTSPVTAENTFTYTPTAYISFPYVLKGLVSDGEQTASFQSAGLLVALENGSRIISVVPDRTIASPGEKITWTVTVDHGTPANSLPVKLKYILYRERGVFDPVDHTEWVNETTYSFVPTVPGPYLLNVFIDVDGTSCHADAPIVQVISPMLTEFDMAIDPGRFPNLILQDATPAPTLKIPEIIVPHADFSDMLATTRPPMAPEKQKPTPKPTLIPINPVIVRPGIRLP